VQPVPPILDPPSSVVQLPPVASAKANEARPWGFWLTCTFSLCIFGAYVVPQAMVAILAAVLKGSISRPNSMAELAMNGLVIGVGILISTPVAVGCCCLFAWLKRGMSVAKYLGIARVTWKDYGLGVVAIVLFNLLFAAVGTALGRPEVPESMLQIYRSAGVPPLLWAAMVVGAPLTEEVLFRGFLFQGFEHSTLGSAGAVVLTSLAWAVIHLQYDLYDVVVIFGMGLVLGVFRWKTGSLLPALVMHVLNNLAATVQVAMILSKEQSLSALL